ncbi:hypothetical protein, partial [Streptomyces sp. SYSU K21746]
MTTGPAGRAVTAMIVVVSGATSVRRVVATTAVDLAGRATTGAAGRPAASLVMTGLRVVRMTVVGIAGRVAMTSGAGSA